MHRKSQRHPIIAAFAAIICGAFLAVGGIAASAFAAGGPSATTGLNVQAEVPASDTLQLSTASLDLGQLNPGQSSAPGTVTWTATISDPNGAGIDVIADAGDFTNPAVGGSSGQFSVSNLAIDGNPASTSTPVQSADETSAFSGSGSDSYVLSIPLHGSNNTPPAAGTWSAPLTYELLPN